MDYAERAKLMVIAYGEVCKRTEADIIQKNLFPDKTKDYLFSRTV